MENTAKNFALQLGSLISLYISLTALIAFLFGVITVRFPDVINGYYEYESAARSIRFFGAMLIVFFPTYLLLTRLVNQIRRKEQGTYLSLTKWLIYLSLLIGGAVILGDLVAVINEFLSGELGIRFILKALVVLIVVGAGFVYYLLDARNFWQSHERESIQYGGIVLVLVLASLVVGFMNTETPSEVRETRIDQTQINDLMMIQYTVENYYRINENLPTTLEEAYGELPIPAAPEGREAYSYKVSDVDTFELCAVFAAPSIQAQYANTPMMDVGMVKNPYDWEHTSGNWCFTRVITLLPTR